MSEENIKLLVNFYRLVKFYEFDDRHKGNNKVCNDVSFFYEVVIELVDNILRNKKILELSTPKVKRFAEVIRYLMQEDELEIEVVSVFCKLCYEEIKDDVREKLNSSLKDKNFIQKYKGI